MSYPKTHQWFRHPTSDPTVSATPISGAASLNYASTDADVTFFIHLAETIAGPFGLQSARSNVLGPITAGPSNPDSFAGAPALPQGEFLVWVDTTTATTSPDEDAVLAAGGRNLHSIWYQWTPSFSGPVQIHVLGSVVRDTQLYLFTGVNPASPSDLTQVAFNDDSDFGAQSQIVTSVTSGTPYWIAVNGYSDTDYGMVRLEGHRDDGDYYLGHSFEGLTSFDGGAHPTSGVLNLYGNSLTSFSGAGMPALEVVSLQQNNLTSLDLSASPILQYLDVSYNGSLASLDLSHNPELRVLNAAGTGLSSVALASAPHLLTLDISNAGVASLSGLSALTDLRVLEGAGANLPALDLSANAALQRLVLQGASALAALTLPASAPGLEYLDLSYTALSALDLTAYTGLKYADLSFMDHLTSVDVRANSALETLLLNENTAMTSIRLPTSAPNLTDLELSDTYGAISGALDLRIYPKLGIFNGATMIAVTSLNLAGCAALHYLYVNGMTSLAALDTTGCTALTYVSLTHVALPQSAVDGLLIQLDGQGLHDGQIFIDAVKTPAPGSLAATAVANLQAKGWALSSF